MSIRSETPLAVGAAAGTMLEVAKRMRCGAGGWSLDYAATARSAAEVLLAECRTILASMEDEVRSANEHVRKLKALGRPTSPSEMHANALAALTEIADAGPRLTDSQLAAIWMYALTWGSGCPVHDDLDALLMARALLSDDLRTLEQRAPALSAWILRAGAAA